MLTQMLIFIVETLGHLFVLALLTRFYAQALRAPFRVHAGNPLADFIVALTDWAVLPLRRIVPGIWKLDLASFLAAWLALVALGLFVFALQGSLALAHPSFWPALACYALVELAKLSLYLLCGVLIVQALLSWVNPRHPMMPFFDALTRPFLRPLQRIIPLIGGVDLSPLFVLILVQVLLMGPIAYLTFEAGRLIARLAVG